MQIFSQRDNVGISQCLIFPFSFTMVPFQWSKYFCSLTDVLASICAERGKHVCFFVLFIHYIDVIMGVMASQITSLTIVYSTVYSDTDQRKHQRSTSLAFVRGIHRWPVNSLHKWPVTRKMFPFDDVIMAIWIVFVLNSWVSFTDMLPLAKHMGCIMGIHVHNYPTRQADLLYVQFAATKRTQRTLKHYGIKLWNSLYHVVHPDCAISTFKCKLKSFLLS